MIRIAEHFSTWKVAVAAVAILTSTGWADEKTHEQSVPKGWVILERQPTREWKLSNGKNQYIITGIVTAGDVSDPKTVETLKRHHEEMKQLLAQKKYEFIKTLEILGQKQYLYKFTYADGSHSGMPFLSPLDNVVSWDEYLRKMEQKQAQQHDQINKALAAGRYRLIDTDVTLIHICREVATNQKYRVQRIPLPDPKDKALHREIATYRPFDRAAEQKATTIPQTSWQGHLDAVRDGKWVLLSEETLPTYQYEVVLDDGSRTIFRYGGGKPLEKPQAK